MTQIEVKLRYLESLPLEEVLRDAIIMQCMGEVFDPVGDGYYCLKPISDEPSLPIVHELCSGFCLL
jgi:hypothetical protein